MLCSDQLVRSSEQNVQESPNLKSQNYQRQGAVIAFWEPRGLVLVGYFVQISMHVLRTKTDHYG